LVETKEWANWYIEVNIKYTFNKILMYLADCNSNSENNSSIDSRQKIYLKNLYTLLGYTPTILFQNHI